MSLGQSPPCTSSSHRQKSTLSGSHTEPSMKGQSSPHDAIRAGTRTQVWLGVQTRGCPASGMD